MASPTLCASLLFVLLAILTFTQPLAEAQVDDAGLQLMTSAYDWPTTASAIYSYPFAGEADEDADVDDEKSTRRALFWHRVHYYISYGALSANRVPCPPRSGRSYYTHNCYRARGPVHPYYRGCSAITRCRR